MQNLDSLPRLDLAASRRLAYELAAAPADSSGVYSSLDGSPMFLPSPARAALSPAGLLDAAMTWLGSPLGVATLTGLLLLLYGSVLWSARKGAIKRALAVAAQAAKEEAQRVELADLQTHNEHLVALLRTRDRYMVQYEAVSLLDEEPYAQWAKHTWKIIARNQLAMTKAVRPLLYADYRARVRVLSASYGSLPGPALAALREQLEWRAQPVVEAFAIDEKEETLVTSASLLDWIGSSSATVVPVATEVTSDDDLLGWLDTAQPVAAEATPAPMELYKKHQEQRNREVEELFES